MEQPESLGSGAQQAKMPSGNFGVIRRSRLGWDLPVQVKLLKTLGEKDLPRWHQHQVPAAVISESWWDTVGQEEPYQDSPSFLWQQECLHSLRTDKTSRMQLFAESCWVQEVQIVQRDWQSLSWLILSHPLPCRAALGFFRPWHLLLTGSIMEKLRSFTKSY